MTQTHSLQIFRVIPFVSRQNNTETTVKQLKMMKREMTSLLFGGVVVFFSKLFFILSTLAVILVSDFLKYLLTFSELC